MSTRFITVFRDPQNALDWDFHISENADELRQVHHNLAARGAKTGASYVLGEKVADVPDVIKET